MAHKALLITLMVLLLSSCGQKLSTADSQVSEVDFGLSEATIGAFNLMRLTPTNKDYRRLVELVDDTEINVFAALEIMSQEAAETLLFELNRYSNEEWAMSLSLINNGETTYKEWFAYYYQTRYVRPVKSGKRFCDTYSATHLKVNTCYARDFYTDGPDFSRDPFVGHFQIGRAKYTLVAVHLIYGGYDQDSIKARVHEVGKLRKVMDKVKKTTPTHDVVLLGDFNLKLDLEYDEGNSQRVKAIIPEEFVVAEPTMTPLITAPTTIGKSNFDHFFFFDSNRFPHIDESEKVRIDFDTTSYHEKETYKSEVSDHFLIHTQFSLN